MCLSVTDIIKDMYKGVPLSVWSVGGISNKFLVIIGIHQESVLSSYFFTFIMKELTRELKEEENWCMLPTDNIVLDDDTKVGLTLALKHNICLVHKRSNE